MNRFRIGMLLGVSLLPLLGANNPPDVLAFPISSTPCQTCLRLLDDQPGRKNRLGNPIYTLEIYQNGTRIYAFKAVTGRAHTQSLDRHQSGQEAPLQDGRYQIHPYSIPATLKEAGSRFIPITPLFPTRRSALGIHYDPSYNKRNGEDGTSGCIGLTTKTDFEVVRTFIETYKPQFIIVYIQTESRS